MRIYALWEDSDLAHFFSEIKPPLPLIKTWYEFQNPLGTMGGLLVGGLMLKTVGWRVNAFSLGVYGGIYIYLDE